MTKIVDVHATAIAIPRGSTLTTSYGARNDAVTVVVEVVTDDGVSGFGQAAVDAPFYGETAEGIVVNVHNYLKPALYGESPLSIELLNQKMRRALPDHWASHSGVELALWDLKGKLLGVPVYQLLGGKFRDGVDLMGSVNRAEPDQMAKEATRKLDETPYPVMKIKIGMDPEEDVHIYRAVAEAVAGRAVIQADGNAGYTMADALIALPAMTTIGGIGAFEQPVARLDDLAELARRIDAPFMADEAIYGPGDAISVIRQRAASIALMKLSKHGGILNVQKIAAVFESAGLVLSVALYYDLIAAAAIHLAAALPCVQLALAANDDDRLHPDRPARSPRIDHPCPRRSRLRRRGRSREAGALCVG